MKRLPLLLILTACSGPPLQEDENRTAVFDEIVSIVREQFMDPGIVEKRFKPIVPAFRARVRDLSTDEAFAALINEMLGVLKTSHTAYFTRSDPRYYLLAALFHTLPALEAKMDEEAIRRPSLGLITREIDGRIFAAAVLDGSPASKAGIHLGDEILSLDGLPYTPVDSIAGKTGGTVQLKIRRMAGGPSIAVTLSPVRINPLDEYLSAQKESVKCFQVEDFKIGYIHIWSYAGEQYHRAFLDALSTETLRDADALLWDLREGPGGANPDYLNVFNRKVPRLEFSGRDGAFDLLDGQWRKPVAMLVNRHVRSGKEILAFGFRKYGIGKVIGERTAGAVAGGSPFLLSNGAILFLAVRSVRVDGEILEGIGVSPDIEVPMDIRYLGGRDVQVEKGLDHLITVLKGKGFDERRK